MFRSFSIQLDLPGASIISFRRVSTGFSPGIWPLLMKTSPELKPSSTTSLAICERLHRSNTYKPIRTPPIPRGWVHHPPPFLAPPSRIDIEFLERFTRTPRSSCFLHFQFRRAMYPQSVRDPSRQNRTRLGHVCRYERSILWNFTFPAGSNIVVAAMIRRFSGSMSALFGKPLESASSDYANRC